MSDNSKPTPAVYRRRRIIALLVLVVVIALIWWGISALVGALSGSDTESTAAPTATATQAADPHPTTAAPEPDPTPPPTPTPTAEPTPEPCTSQEVRVTAQVDAAAYGPDEQPQFSLKLTNESNESCIMDVGTGAQVYTVTSGSDTIWVSTHCQQDPQSQEVEVTPGKEVTAPAFAWERERSSADTCDEDRPDAVGGGAYYNLTVEVDGIVSEPVAFSLE